MLRAYYSGVSDFETIFAILPFYYVAPVFYFKFFFREVRKVIPSRFSFVILNIIAPR